MNAPQTTYHVALTVEAETRADWDIAPSVIAEAVRNAMEHQRIVAFQTPNGMRSVTVTAVNVATVDASL